MYASDPFLQEATGRDIGRMIIDPAETDQVVRMARASEPIPLGAIALISPDQARSIASRDVVAHGKSSEPGTALEDAIMLRRIDNGYPTNDKAPWAHVAREHGQDGKTAFRLGVAPDERAIALNLYNAAQTLPGKPENDEWFEQNIGTAAQMLGGLLGSRFKPVADALGNFGQNIGNLRREHDLQTVGNRRPVVLEPRS